MRTDQRYRLNSYPHGDCVKASTTGGRLVLKHLKARRKAEKLEAYLVSPQAKLPKTRLHEPCQSLGIGE